MGAAHLRGRGLCRFALLAPLRRRAHLSRRPVLGEMIGCPAESHGKDQLQPRCGRSIPLGHLAGTVSCRLKKLSLPPSPGHTLDARHGRRPSVSITDMARHTAIFALVVRSRVPIATSRPRRSRRATHPDRFDTSHRRRRSVQNLSDVPPQLVPSSAGVPGSRRFRRRRRDHLHQQ